MDWKRVKSILIALLLVTNLILGYSVYSQFRSVSRTEQAALAQALAMAGELSGLRADMLSPLPSESQSFSVPRDSVLENAFAAALLGESGFVSENTGGGIVLYKSGRGSGEIKTGGEMDFTLTWPEGELSAQLPALLREAGLELLDTDITAAPDGSLSCSQRFSGLSLDRYALTGAVQDGTLSLTGRWLLCAQPEVGAAAPRKSELVLYLSQWLESGQQGPALGLTPGYRVAENLVRPIWLVQLENGTAIFDLLDRRIVR